MRGSSFRFTYVLRCLPRAYMYQIDTIKSVLLIKKVFVEARVNLHFLNITVIAQFEQRDWLFNELMHPRPSFPILGLFV